VLAVPGDGDLVEVDRGERIDQAEICLGNEAILRF